LFRIFLRWVGLVGDTDETVDLLADEFVGELGFEFVNGAGTEQQRGEVHRDRRASDLDAVAVGDFVAEPLGVALDRVPINLKTVPVLENPFNASERILRGVKQTGVDDGLSVVAILVEQLRDITLKSASAVRTFVELDVDGDPLKALISNEPSEGSVLVAVFRCRPLSQYGQGRSLPSRVPPYRRN